MERLNFTIDSHLLLELGERLVGRPYIALAELVKNAFDADANHCEIFLYDNEIEVCDDGHGMTFAEFRDFWMRIGTTNKVKQQLSRVYGRPLTGSKGIGRLAVQFLAKKVEIVTTSALTNERVYAEVDWDKAIEAGDLTEAVAHYSVSNKRETYANSCENGTRIRLKTLNHDWSYDEDDHDSPVRSLAREVWMLQPPFADATRGDHRTPEAFSINLLANDERVEHLFQDQLSKVLEVWDAKIAGEIRSGRSRNRCAVAITFRDGDSYNIDIPIEPDQIDCCDFEIRIFKLYGKQPEGVPVDEARAYFKEFGGVHVYDGGFRLPYYGIEQDWLAIQLDHSRRLSLSSLLPTELNVPLAMHDLPTTERMFGVVNIGTTLEFRRAGTAAKRTGNLLKINIGRDRLVDNSAYQELRRVVRWSIDYYATRYQLRQEREVSRLRPKEAPDAKLDRLRKTIAEIKPSVPAPLHTKLVHEVEDYYDGLEKENRYVERQTALLAPLAAAGLASLAFEHENNRQLRRLDRLVSQLSEVPLDAATDPKTVDQIVTDFRSWIRQYRETRRLFTSLTTSEDREDARRLRAKATVEIVLHNTKPLLRQLDADISDIPDGLLLPTATMADWQALFQNVFVNASNAMLDSPIKRLRITGGALSRSRSHLTISDTGVGVDLNDSDALFEPFMRRLEVSEERRSLGLGGMGLGLTIVRMICEARNCRYGFVEPGRDYASAFQLTWGR